METLITHHSLFFARRHAPKLCLLPGSLAGLEHGATGPVAAPASAVLPLHQLERHTCPTFHTRNLDVLSKCMILGRLRLCELICCRRLYSRHRSHLDSHLLVRWPRQHGIPFCVVTGGTFFVILLLLLYINPRGGGLHRLFYGDRGFSTRQVARIEQEIEVFPNASSSSNIKEFNEPCD